MQALAPISQLEGHQRPPISQSRFSALILLDLSATFSATSDPLPHVLHSLSSWEVTISRCPYTSPTTSTQ